MSQAGAAGSAGGGAGLVNSITGDTGTTVQGAVLLYGHTGSANAGSSVKFNGVSTTEMDLVVTDASSNTIIGASSGNATISGNTCTGLGANVLPILSSGSALVAVGNNALAMATTDSQCTAIGFNALTTAQGSYQNTCTGYDAGARITNAQQNTLTGVNCGANFITGSFNTGMGSLCLGACTGQFNSAFGLSCLYQLQGGSYQIALGYGAGQSYNGTESSCIVIGNNGVMGESNVMRLGTTGSGNLQVNETFIAGIVGNTVSNTEMVTINSSTGQMGVSTVLYPGVASNTGTSAAPTGTASATYVNMGLGSSWNLTPSNYTSVRIHINGQMVNNTTGDGINIIMCYGTGAAPGNGTGPTGTTVGINTIFTDLTGLLTNGVPFSKEYIITGLTATTAYWFDLQVKAVTGGTASVLNCEFTAQELQY